MNNIFHESIYFLRNLFYEVICVLVRINNKKIKKFEREQFVYDHYMNTRGN